MHPTKFIIVPFLLLSVLANSQNLKSGKATKQNHIFILAGAPAIYAGASYEYLVFNSHKVKVLPRAGFGLNIFKPSFGKEFDFHLGVTGLYGNNHNLEAGIGTIHYLINQTEIENNSYSIEYKFGIYGILGYRYNFVKNPISLKIAITPVLFANSDKWVFFPLAEIGAGLRF